jgi:DNA-binding transcriptional MerR regulator
MPTEQEVFSTREVLTHTGVDPSALKTWVARRQLLPSIHIADGPSDDHEWSFRDMVLIRTVNYLRKAGVEWDGIRPILKAVPEGDVESLGGLPILVRTWHGECRLIDELEDVGTLPDSDWSLLRLPLWFIIRALRACVEAGRSGSEEPMYDAARAIAATRAARRRQRLADETAAIFEQRMQAMNERLTEILAAEKEIPDAGDGEPTKARDGIEEPNDARRRGGADVGASLSASGDLAAEGHPARRADRRAVAGRS